MHIPDELRTKLEPKSKKTYLVGYGINQKGYRVWDPDKNVVYISRDIIFDEIHIGLDKNIEQPDDFFLDDTEEKEYKVKCIVKERLNYRECEFYMKCASYDDSDNTWKILEYMKDTIALKEWEKLQNTTFLTGMNSYL